jgi:hypothetical protein
MDDLSARAAFITGGFLLTALAVGFVVAPRAGHRCERNKK